MNELFSEGLHHGAAAVEIGNPDMDSEKSLKWINEIQYDGKKTHIICNTFFTLIKNLNLNSTPETPLIEEGTLKQESKKTLRTFPMRTNAQWRLPTAKVEEHPDSC